MKKIIKSIKRNGTKLTLIFILCIAAFFRLYQLNSVPPAPSVDEVATGYTAYSVLHTGRGEFGKLFPLVLRSYDDYKPALYMYFVVPSVALFGLTALAVRLPAALLSILSVLAIYFLAKELCKGYKYNTLVGLASAFFLAICPWHIYISRLGFEANAGLAFTIFAFTFLLQKKGFFDNIFLCSCIYVISVRKDFYSAYSACSSRVVL